MPDAIMGFLFLLLNAVSMLVLFATWQRTHILGFLLLAIGYGLAIVGRWTTPLLSRVLDMGSDGAGQWIFLAVQAVYLFIAALSLVAFWDIYRRLAKPSAPTPTA